MPSSKRATARFVTSSSVAGMATFGDVETTLGDDYVATVQIRRPPNNYFDANMIGSLADAIESLDADPACRAVVLCSEGKHFCAGAAFSSDGQRDQGNAVADTLYAEAVRLFQTRTPVVAAVQGAAIGGGLGVACFADFRVCAPEARFSANFARLGFHQGFGLSVTLPVIVGQQAALDLLYTGRRVKGDEAVTMGLADKLASSESLPATAHALAVEIARSAPLAVDSIRQTMRGDLAERVRVATDHEWAEQTRLRATADFKEGIRATAERRTPDFRGE